ncbi:MAG TPA: ABC transporter ATP-binding protein [Lacipirellulaceae bacterium]
MVAPDKSPDEPAALPEGWRRPLEAELADGERIIAWFDPDLNARLHFAEGLVVLTDQRILSGLGPEAEEAQRSRTGSIAVSWDSWPLEAAASLRSREQVGLGTLELLGQASLLSSWRFTATRSAQATQFVQRFLEYRAARANPAGAGRAAATVCLSCGATLEPGQTVCPACNPVASPPPVRSLWRLARFAKSHAKIIMLGFVLTLVSTAAVLVPPYLTKPLTNDVLIPLGEGTPVPRSLVYFYLGGLFGAAILAWLLSWAKTYVLAWVSEKISADLRDETYAHMQKLSLEFFGGKRTGDLIARVGSDTDRICNFLSVNLIDFGTDVLMIVMTAGILFWQDKEMALVTLLPFPIIAWMAQRVRVRLRHGFARASAAWAEMVNVLADTIPGIRVVKAFAQEQREVERFGQRNQHVLDANIRVNVLWAAFGPAVTLLTDCGMLVIWGYGAWKISQRQGFDVGALVMFIGYMRPLYIRLDSMSRMLPATQRAGAATHRIFEILDRVPSVAEPTKPVHPERIEGRLEFRNVSFNYGTRRVIRDVNLTIEPGEMIGLVGPSGAGKSTLVNLVCRFYDVASGGILVDGIDIRSFVIAEYRHNIGIVLQEPFLFFGTVAENISYARPEASRAQIIAAARASRAHEFILKLPDGYDSIVGERGQTLSGGERQRISIARALLTDPRILILDEATSSVDNETEREIQEALDNLIRGRTTIAIAHRLSTLRKADRLVVLEDGQITAVGRHEDLLESSATYARLQQSQMESIARVGA